MENIEQFGDLVDSFESNIFINKHTIKWFMFFKKKLKLTPNSSPRKDSMLIFRCFALASFIGKLLEYSKFYIAGYFENDQEKQSNLLYNFFNLDFFCQDVKDIDFTIPFFSEIYKSGISDDVHDVMSSLFIHQSCLLVIIKDVKEWPPFYSLDGRPTMCWLHCLGPKLSSNLVELLLFIVEKGIVELNFDLTQYFNETQRNKLNNIYNIGILSSNHMQNKAFDGFSVLPQILSRKQDEVFNDDFIKTLHIIFPTNNEISLSEFLQPFIGSIMYHPVLMVLKFLNFTKENRKKITQGDFSDGIQFSFISTYCSENLKRAIFPK